MGGICAVVDLVGDAVDPQMVSRMMAVAGHRGIVNGFTRATASAVLGQLSHRPTRAATQTAEHSSAIAVWHGSLHNKKELTAQLRDARLLTAESPSESHLIAAAYQLWGSGAPAHMLGDYVFVVWHPPTRTLLAARDPGGSRPLYVRYDGKRVFLASEVKQILAVSEGPHHINEEMLGAYLMVAGGRPEWTFYSGIDQVPRGHAVHAGPEGFSIDRFWDIDPNAIIRYPDMADYADHLRDVFVQAVACRINDRDRVGVWLSGGLDSSSVASAMGQLSEQGWPGSVTAFSYAFDDLRDADERHVSRYITEHYGLSSKDIPADDAWPLRNAPLHGPDQDEPLMGAYQVLHDRVYSAASEEGVDAMFTGASGDNISGGDVFDYPGQLLSMPAQGWRDLRAHAKWSEGSLVRFMTRRLAWPMMAKFLTAPREMGLRRHVRRLNRATDVPDWIRTEFATRLDLEEIATWRPASPEFDERARRLRYDVVMDVISTRGLIWNERNHAQSGLDYVDPWGDRRLAEFSTAVPQWLFNRGTERKVLVRDAMRGIIPETARRTAGKIYPDSLYVRGIDERERDRVSELLRNSQLSEMGVIDASLLLDRIRSGTSHGAEWPVLSTEMWIRRYWT